LGSNLGFFGARFVGKAINGNAFLELNKNYALGAKGFILQLPEDKVIFEFIRFKGKWELDECVFLSAGLQKIQSATGGTFAMIDIGANTGLVSLQTTNLAKTSHVIHCFEPLPRHAEAIRYNLRNIDKKIVHEFALSSNDELAVMLSQDINYGNSSLIEFTQDKVNKISTQVKAVNTSDFFFRELMDYSSFVIKSDIQGMDSLVLSEIPKIIWEKTECAVIEIWAIPEVKPENVRKLVDNWQNFHSVSWTPTGEIQVDLEDVYKFWTSKNRLERNLFCEVPKRVKKRTKVVSDENAHTSK
jgi:FkbM family methyltransferase